MSDPNNIPPPPPQPENNPYPERPPIFDNPEAPEYQSAEQQPGPGAPPPPPHQSAPAGGTPTKDERNWAMFAHLSMLVIGLISAAIGLPIFGFLGPLVIYLMKKDESEFIADQAREALNFAISVSIILLGLLILSLLVITLIITVPGMLIVGLGSLVLVIMAGIKASNGERYRYPFTIRLIN